MTLVDANVLIYAVNPDSPQHEKARRWLEGALSGSESVGLAWSAHLAALALYRGSTLVSTDRDFLRYAGLSVMNPLEALAESRRSLL